MKKITTLLLAYSLIAFGAVDPAAAQLGSNVGNTSMSVFGSKDGVNNRLAKPLMSTTQMTTVDGSKSFNAQVQCPASSKSIGIMFIPSGGNDYRLMVQQDTDLNGAYDYTYDTSTLGKTVSGVCTNGVVMCSPAGTWSNCTNYVWDTNGKKVFLRAVPHSSHELGGCYCSNNSCGVNSLAPQIYENIGGGISAAIMKSNPLFILSKSEWSWADMSYYLYGQDKTNCSGLGASNWDKYGEKNPTKYYDAQVPPSTSIGDVALAQGGDPNSYYSLISHQNQVAYDTAGNKIGMPSKVSCSVSKALVPTIVTAYETCPTVSWNGQTWCQSAHHGWVTNFATAGGITVDLRKYQSLYAVADGHYSLCDDDYSILRLKYSGSVSANLQYGCGDGISSGKVIPIVGSAGERMSINIDLFTQTNYGSADAYNIHVYKSSSYKKEEFSITTSDNCPTGCQLIDEQVCEQGGTNCVYTIRDSVKQNIVIQKKCVPYSSDITSGMTCADGNNIAMQSYDGTTVLYTGSDSWFNIKRTYQCDNKDIMLDPSKMTTAASTASKTDSSATSMTYTDADGSVKTITNLPGGDDCPTPVCTVQRPSIDTSQFADQTNRSQTAKGTATTETIVKTCTKTSGVATCPIDSALGETKIEECSCTGSMKGFQKAVTTLGVVSESSKDMICSQN